MFVRHNKESTGPWTNVHIPWDHSDFPFLFQYQFSMNYLMKSMRYLFGRHNIVNNQSFLISIFLLPPLKLPCVNFLALLNVSHLRFIPQNLPPSLYHYSPPAHPSFPSDKRQRGDFLHFDTIWLTLQLYWPRQSETSIPKHWFCSEKTNLQFGLVSLIPLPGAAHFQAGLLV